MPHPHVIQVANNSNGNDFIATDVHGSLPLLAQMFAKLGENDRLFLCGDLIDRGKNSLGVIEAIKAREASHRGQVRFIRGNHEDLALHAIKIIAFHQALQKYPENTSLDPSEI